jgi:hypothetical protein
LESKLKNIIVNLIEKKQEGEYWDYKEQWHKSNERLIHDILNFANTVHDKDCYLIIGVTDTGGIKGIEESRKQSDILDIISGFNFAGNNIPEIKLETISIDNKILDILVIYNSDNVPYYLLKRGKKYNEVREGFIYTRIGDRNTPINENGNILRIELLWKKRFGLSKPPLEQVKNMLNKKEEWSEREEGTHYNIYQPEYQIMIEWDYERPSRLEFYSYVMTNESTSYGKITIRDKETNLFSTFVISLDSGRYIVTQSDWGFLHFDRYKRDLYGFKYYIEDSLEYELYKFLYNKSNHEQYYANMKFFQIIIIFKDENEKEDFISYIENSKDKFFDKIENTYDYIEEENKLAHDKIVMELKTGEVLNEMLEEFRKINN